MSAAGVLNPEVRAAFYRAAERFLRLPVLRPGDRVEVYTSGAWCPATVADACDVPGCVVVRFDVAPAGCVPGALYVVLDHFARSVEADAPVMVDG
jgi:hypothetical protein